MDEIRRNNEEQKGPFMPDYLHNTDVDELKSKAEAGDAESQFLLGYSYASGHGVPQDLAEAIRWLRQSSEQEHAKAQYNLALFTEMV